MATTQAIFTTIHDRIKQQIEDLRLRYSPRVIVAKRFNEIETPQNNTIYVCRSSERFGAGTIGADEIGYPAVLFMVRGTGGAQEENAEVVSHWREDIRERFCDKRDAIRDLNLTDVTPLIARVDFGSDFLDEFWQRRWDVNHMQILVWIRKLRSAG